MDGVGTSDVIIYLPQKIFDAEFFIAIVFEGRNKPVTTLAPSVSICKRWVPGYTYR
jgi:hypothetical protein